MSNLDVVLWEVDRGISREVTVIVNVAESVETESAARAGLAI